MIQWRRLHRARGARAPPTFTNDSEGHGGHREYSKQETDQTVLTITKALTKTTNCTFQSQKGGGARQKNRFRRFAPDGCPPHFQIRSGATGDSILYVDEMTV